MDIITQPAVNALLVAYKPIEFRVQIDTSIDDCPLMFCDIYINNTYYKSHSKTTPLLRNATSKTFQFDIEDALQEYLSKYIAPCGAPLAYTHPNGMASVFVKFRETIINGDGFIESPATPPIQGTFETSPTAGGGVQSNTFYVVNATLQQKELQTLPQHLNLFKYGTWSVDKYPLTHRLPSCLIKLNQSDYYPILHMESLGIICYVLNYKMKGDTVFSQLSSCGETADINIDFMWNKEINEYVDLSSRINGTFSYINWGDGTIDTSLTHTYLNAGTYQVWIYNCTSTLFDMSEMVDVNSQNVVAAFFASPYYVSDLILYNNQIGSLTLTLLSSLIYCDLHNNQIQSVLGTIPANVTYFDGSENIMDVALVNQVLIDLDNNGLSNGTVDLSNQNPATPPTGAGITAKNNLISKGWSVITD